MQAVTNEIRDSIEERIKMNNDSQKILFPLSPKRLSKSINYNQIIQIIRKILTEFGYELKEHNKCATGNIKFVAIKDC